MEKIIVATRWLVFFQAYRKRDRGILWSFASSDIAVLYVSAKDNYAYCLVPEAMLI